MGYTAHTKSKNRRQLVISNQKGLKTGGGRTRAFAAACLLILAIALLAGYAAPNALYAAAPSQSPAPLPTVPTEDLSRIQSAGKIVVGTSADYEPFAFYNSSFALDGFDIRMAQELGAELGVDVEFKTFAFAGLLDALRLGQVDAAIGAISVTPERQTIVDFSNVYYIDDSAALVRTDSNLVLDEIADFEGLKVAVEAGTTYQSWAQQRLVEPGIIRQQDLLSMNDVNDMITALRSSVVDVAVLGNLPARSLDERYTDITFGGEGFNTQQLGIAVRKGSNLAEPVNRALIALQADGRYGALVQQFLRGGPSPTPGGDTGLIPLPPVGTLAPTMTPTAPAIAVPPTATVPPSVTDAPTAVPAVPATATPTAQPPTATASPTAVPCVYSSAFVEDLTFDDQNMTAPPQMIPGLSFDKTWRILNSGNCQWEPDFALFYVSGNRPEASMDGRPVPVGRVVLPGQTVDLTANLVAPSSYGIFQGFWQMRNNLGNFFGETVWVGIDVPNPNPPTATPVPPTPVPAATATPGPVGWTGNPNLRADSQWINAGQCTNIRWDVDGVNAVFFVEGGNVMGKGGHDLQTVCPPFTQTFELRVITLDNQTQSFFITINVAGAPPPPAINFWADRTEIRRGECTTLRWDVQGVQAVFYQDQGVPGVSSSEECPGSDRTYRLRVIRLDGGEDRREVFVRVIQSGGGGGGAEWTPDE
jgi:polar amino acid transport system substrate-binding protein